MTGVPPSPQILYGPPPAGSRLSPAKFQQMIPEAIIYVHNKRAVVTSIDGPLVFFRFDGQDVIKHRSFMHDGPLFMVDYKDHPQEPVPPTDGVSDGSESTSASASASSNDGGSGEVAGGASVSGGSGSGVPAVVDDDADEDGFHQSSKAPSVDPAASSSSSVASTAASPSNPDSNAAAPTLTS